ncbi:MAG: DUF952 domain-containing protein [Rhizobiaceae bacterium]
MTELIYKICSRILWDDAKTTGVFKGAEIDLSDGYIHFSTADQVETTVALHFSGQTDLLLIAVDAALLGVSLKYEPSRGGDLFPHLYGDLSMNAVQWVCPLPLGNDGRHVFPDLKTGVSK